MGKRVRREEATGDRSRSLKGDPAWTSGSGGALEASDRNWL